MILIHISAGHNDCAVRILHLYIRIIRDLKHFPVIRINESVSSRIAKIDLYSDKELLRRADQRFSVWKAFSKCSWRFLRFYVVKGGFRDGKAGFTYAVLNACYKFATIAKIWERQSSED